MSYDSATDTALASQAYQRALAAAQQQRDRLNNQFGLNADGTLNNTPSGNLGSIYRAGLAGEQQWEQAASADRARGFGGSGGLAGRAQARARQGAIDNQALSLRDATDQLGSVTQGEQAAGQDYQSNLGNIRNKSAFDLAQTLAANPVLAPSTPPTPVPGSPFSGPQLGGSLTNYGALFKSNPKRYGTIKGKF